MRRFVITLFILCMAAAVAFSQELRLVVSDKPLNAVLNTLGVEVSFNDKAMATYRVSVSKTFSSADEALAYLLKDKPFNVEKIGSIYVISTQKQEASVQASIPQKRYYTYKGLLIDQANGERIPYAYIQTDKGVYTSDQAGVFSFVSDNAIATRVRIQYLGYEDVDTVLNSGNTTIRFNPKSVEISTATVRPSPTSMMMQSGYSPSEIRINHNVARYMPGSSDNSVFTLLRMMPGVRASGEPSEDLIVWGSGSGESRIVFDGFTLFGMKNFNDHIGSANPYLVKDIRLMKGSYDASKGGSTGAIAEITGIDGSTLKPSVKATLSNYTANVFASIPVTKRSALMATYRQTFYNLYDEDSYEATNGNGQAAQNTSDIYLKPRYTFRDANLKYSGKTKSGDNYYASLYAADDRFKFSVTQDGAYAVDANEKNNQYAGAAGYEKSWNNGSSSYICASFSRYAALIDNITSVGEGADNKLVKTRTDNTIQELAFKAGHTLNIGKYHQLKAGAEWAQYKNKLNARYREINTPSLFITDNITLGKFSLDVGLRASVPSSGELGLSPRAAARYRISEELTATASWGIYRQFISKIPYQYSTGHFEMVWSLSDTTFMRAYHTTAGMAYSKNGLLLSIEGYWRQTHNGVYFLDNGVYASDNTVIGVDLFAKKEFRRHTLFASYSIAGLREPIEETSHELKLGGLSSIGSFYFSASYVFGSGFSYLSTGGHRHGQEGDRGHGQNEQHAHNDDGESHSYNRFDIAVTYRLKRDKWQLQAGISLLNIFDSNNVKYSYRLNDQDRVTNIYTKATPFTPMVFAEIAF